MAGFELVVHGSETFQTFQFGRDEKMAVVVVTHIKGDDTDRVAGDQVGVVFFVVEGEGKDAAEPFDATGYRICGRGRG